MKAVIFGDLSLNVQSVNRADFYADFAIHNTTDLFYKNMSIMQREENTNQTRTMISFKVGHLRLTSFQKISDDLSLTELPMLWQQYRTLLQLKITIVIP